MCRRHFVVGVYIGNSPVYFVHLTVGVFFKLSESNRNTLCLDRMKQGKCKQIRKKLLKYWHLYVLQLHNNYIVLVRFNSQFHIH